MSSPTQRVLSHGEVVDWPARRSAPIRGCARSKGSPEAPSARSGGLTWPTAAPVVLKVGPEVGTRLLTYEAGMVAAEAE